MKSCFVVMAIGDQTFEGKNITASELRDRYTGLIKESIESASEDIEVIRADEVSTSGSISTDIFKRIMLSDYVVVDLTYPNPNVFYELGLRHAIRNKTILIKEKGSKNNPFDISGLRYIEYEDTGAGLRKLKEQLSQTFAQYEEAPGHVDNDFLAIALSMGLCFQKIVRDPKKEAKKKAMQAMFKNKELLAAFSDPEDKHIAELFANTENLDEIVAGLVDSGDLDD
ncbi:hypothetical protein GNT15_23600 [Vibrio parahaemolyticus]|nr:hypothetical protein [Vibrio parahaemolyticus]